MWIVALIGGVLGAVAIVIGSASIKKILSRSSGQEIQEIGAKIEEVTGQLTQLGQSSENLASKAQLDTISKMLEDVKSELANENWRLKEIESKLDAAQKTVEGKEAQQQEIKSAREEDEVKVAELLANYEDISGESIALEQQLAQSLKNLDTMMNELILTGDQKALLMELSEALSNSGSRLRDLLTEYEKVHERLEALKMQHTELEEEYTKLVEQQLGE
jgi:chromosome segregation ATPase